MGDLISSVLSILIGMAVLVGFLLLLYGAAMLLPRRVRQGGAAFAFLIPCVLAVTVGLLIPVLRTIYFSLHSDGSKHQFIGLKNYGDILTYKPTRLTVVTSLTWVVVGTIATTLLSLIIARFADGMKGEKAAKSIIFIPAATSLVGAGIIWRFVYASPPLKVGLLNQITKAIPGLPTSAGGNGDQNWLLERGYANIKPPTWAPGFNTFLLIVIFIWASAGVSTVILSAAIKGVPESLIEAAKVDGATNKQAFYKVTLPYIRGTIVTVATLTTIAGLKAYDIVAAATGGNFGTSTIANEFMNQIFLQQRESLGSAFAVLMMILVIPVVVINRRAQRRSEELMGS
jgi:alpha-glucoside transport system permease protein